MAAVVAWPMGNTIDTVDGSVLFNATTAKRDMVCTHRLAHGVGMHQQMRISDTTVTVSPDMLTARKYSVMEECGDTDQAGQCHLPRNADETNLSVVHCELPRCTWRPILATRLHLSSSDQKENAHGCIQSLPPDNKQKCFMAMWCCSGSCCRLRYGENVT